MWHQNVFKEPKVKVQKYFKIADLQASVVKVTERECERIIAANVNEIARSLK